MASKVYPIKNFNNYEGLLLPHPQKRVIIVPKHPAELLDVFFRVRIEFGEFFERGHVRGDLLQDIEERGYLGSIARLVDPRRLNGFPKVIGKPELLRLRRPLWPLAIYDLLHHYW